jgi:hypothetical protein
MRQAWPGVFSPPLPSSRNFQGSKGFNSFLSQGLCQRITKMTDFPGFIVCPRPPNTHFLLSSSPWHGRGFTERSSSLQESMVLENMSLGTSLPMVSNATLYSITEQGGVVRALVVSPKIYACHFASQDLRDCLCCGFRALQIVDMDVVYHTGFEMTINIMTSIQLPGASVKVPASAYMQIKRLSGRVRYFSILRVAGTLHNLSVSSTSRM